MLSAPELIESFKGHNGEVTGLAFDSRTAQLCSSGVDKMVMVWSLTPPIRAFRMAGHDDTVTAIASSPTESLLASVSRDCTVRLWTPSIRGQSTFRKAHIYRVRDVSFSHDGLSVLTCSDDKTIKVFDSTKDLNFKGSFRGHTNWVVSARLSPDGRLVASTSDDGTMRLWDTRTLQSCRQFTVDDGLSSSLGAVRWSCDGTAVAVASAVGDVQLWDVRSTTLIQHYSAHTGPVTSLAFHPSGKFLASAGADGAVKILNLVQGKVDYTIRGGHDGGVNSVQFSHDGSVLATGGRDARIMLFETHLRGGDMYTLN